MNDALDTLYARIRRQDLAPEDAIAELRAARQAAKDSTAQAQAPAPEPALTVLRARTTQYLKKLFATVLKQPAERLDADAALDAYGVDSVMAIELTRRLEEGLGELPKTLLFEHDTIHALSRFIVEQRRDRLDALLGLAPSLRIAEPAPPRRAATPQRTVKAPIAAVAEDIAIIGLSGRFPQANDLDALWDNLRNGRDAIGEVPASRWDAEALFDAHKGMPGRSYCRWGGFLDDVDAFDPLFFNISAREAEAMDPQVRLCLETVWQLFEGSGHTREALQQRIGGSVGVFVASMYQHYRGLGGELASESAAALTSFSTIANRLSYAFGLNGPSVAVDTMCSSSAVAIHMAARALRDGECALAVVAGVNLSIHPHKYIGLSQAQMIGSRADSRAFSDGDGYLPAEAVGAVLLKPLSRARADRDRVLAVLKGSATLHSGRSNGFGAPNPKMQAQLLHKVLEQAGVAAGTIGYVEAAANGAALGDASEFAALRRVFGDAPADGAPRCAIGSVKAGIGHAEAASGITQLARVILQMRHRTFAPTPAPTRPNPGIDLDAGAFRLPTEAEPWPRLLVAGEDGEMVELPRRALINSFGAGGTYASLVIEEAPDDDEEDGGGPPASVAAGIVVLSARTAQARVELARRLRDHLARDPQPLAAVARTLQLGREAMTYRLAIVAGDMAGLLGQLDAFVAGGDFAGHANDPEVAAGALARFTSGALGDAIARTLLDGGDANALAQYWSEGGRVPWDSLWPEAPQPAVQLPTYPFARERYWMGRGAALQASAPVQAAKVVSEAGTAARVDALLADLLGTAPASMPPDTTLGSAGLNSVGAITLRHRIEAEFGVAVPLALLAQERLVRGLGAAIDAHLRAAGVENMAAPLRPVIQPDPAGRFEPFPLTDIQEAYLAGRQLRLHGDRAAAHIYLELDATGLDLRALGAAWNRLVAHHDMLRTVVRDGGLQQVLRDVPSFELATTDLRGLAEAHAHAALEGVRRQLGEQDFAPDQWPRFALHALVRDNGQTLCFGIDELLLDATGLRMLLRQWWDLYMDPAHALPALDIGFRDYVLACRRFEATPRHAEDLAYWVERLADLPSGPRVFAGTPRAEGTVRRRRIAASLAPAAWQQLRAHARDLAVSDTVLLLALFSALLRRHASEPRFALTLTLLNRPPLHPQLDALLGPFISTNIVVTEPPGSLGFAQAVERDQRALVADLDHDRVSAVRVLRELRARKRLPGDFALPVVFTSLLALDAPEGADDGGLLARVQRAVNATPQVYLDHQVWQADGALHFSWDVADERFAEGGAQSLFDDYRALLARCAAMPSLREPGFDPAAADDARHAPFPLTDQQTAYAFGRAVAGGGACTVYQEIVWDRIDVPRLEAAWRTLLARHEMLRATLSWDGTQTIAPHVPGWQLAVHDASSGGHEAALAATRERMRQRVFALDGTSFHELALTLTPAGGATLHFAIDLIIADGPSIALLLGELLALYRRPDEALPAIRASFRDHAVALRDPRHAAAREAAERYWEGRFTALPAGPALPRREGAEGGAVVHLNRLLRVWQAVSQRAEALGVRPSTVLLGAYLEALAARVPAEQRPFAVVMPRWERPVTPPGLDRVVGDLTTMSWVAWRDGGDFDAKLSAYQRVLDEDLRHRSASGLTVLRRMRRGAANVPTYPVVFTDLLPTAPGADLSGDDGIRIRESASATPQVELDNIAEVTPDGLRIVWSVREGVHPDGLIESILDDYLARLQAFAARPMPALPDYETCLHTEIERHLQAHATQPCVIDERRELDFDALNRAANRCARRLCDLGVGPGVVVGVMMDRSVELLASVLAVLKAGGAYLPLDPDWPAERLDFTLVDANVPVVLTQAHHLDRLARFDGTSIALDRAWDALAVHDDTDLPPLARPGDVAYVIYTSGSTGRPKGCMIPHRAIVNRLQWMQRMYRLAPGDRVLQKTPVTFDVSVWELFWPLLSGAALVMCRPGGHREPAYLADTIVRQGITVCHFVPSMLHAFLAQPRAAQCRSLRDVFASGEALPGDTAERFRALLPARLHNLYGPTEAAVDVSYWECVPREDGIVPIGRAIDRISLHLLDAALQPVADGEQGELCIGGVGVALGYLNRPELSAEKFIEHPLVPGGRLYRTGDAARRLPDGNLHYLGRMDRQVKLRGFRIELQEIEAVLLAHPEVLDAAVVVQEPQSPDPQLVAYVVMRTSALPRGALREHLAAMVPEYMVPNRFVAIDEMPVTAHGKRDLALLPWPVGAVTERASGRVATNAEAAPVIAAPDPAPAERSARVDELIAFLRDATGGRLDLDGIGPDDNLFERGASSLTLVGLADKIARHYGTAPPLEQWLNRPTIACIVDCLAGEQPAAAAAPVPARVHAGTTTDDIAIVALSGRYPGADSPEAFWARLAAGEDCITEVPSYRWETASFFCADADEAAREGKSYSKWGGFLLPDPPLPDDIPRHRFEATGPASRAETLFVATAADLLRRGGLLAPAARAARRIGVYAGAMSTPDASLGLLANRVSHTFDLQGPSLTVDTVSSSSMTALHLACTALRAGDCEIAIAGGVNVLTPQKYIAYSGHRALASDPAYRSFGAGDGFQLAECVAAVMLKPLAAARADGDAILAVIKASAINHAGGASRFLLPDVERQAELIARCVDAAGFDAATIGSVETAANGIAVNDLAEIDALSRVFARDTAQRQFCGIGTAKSNIGHAEGASGIALLSKAILQLQAGQRAPVLDGPRHPRLQLGATPFQLQTELADWPRLPDPAAGPDQALPRRSLVNSFGSGGSYVSVALQEWIDR